VADFDYGNARLRAMKSRLLPRRELEALAEAGSLQGFISGLARTAYQKPVEAALARASGMESIALAIRLDLGGTLGKARGFFREEAGRMVAIALRPYDIHNLKAILRGLARNVASSEILEALLPIGDLEYAVLSDLARAPGLRAAIDLLASMNEPLAQPLLKLRARHPGAEIPEMERTLTKWHYQEARQSFEQAPSQNEVLASALGLEADVENLLTMLRFAQDPAERIHLYERGKADLEALLVTPGLLKPDLLVRVGSQDSLEAAVELLAGTRYEPALRASLQAYRQTGRLSEFETQLKRFRVSWLSRLIFKDPLGIGVFLGYLALKINEINNLRWIAQGVNMGMGAAEIKAGVGYAT
jgi:V/A-type H+-transporting ATPase subunit C